MEHINKISFAILSQLSKTYNPDFSQLLNKDALGGSLESLADKGGDGTAAATEEDDIVAVAEEEVEEFNEVDNSTNSLSTPAEELTTKKKMAAGNKRVVMTKQMLAQAHAESEEKKLSLLIIQNICMMISLFETPMDRLNSVIEGLSNLIKTDISLRFIDKQLEKVNRKVFLTLRLLDIGYILLTTGFQISLTDNGMQKIFDKFSTLKKMVTSDDVNYLATLGVFDTYSISDAMQLSRMLFEYREWDRFHAIATLMQHHFVTLEQNDIVQGYSREVALRLAVIHFEVLHHSERKVGFGTDVGGNFGTQSDIRSRRFDISLNAHMTVVTLLHTLTGCMESNYLKAESPRLFMDAAIILWRFVEPFLRDLHFLSDAKDYRWEHAYSQNTKL